MELTEIDILQQLNQLPNKSKSDVLGFDARLLRISSEYICTALTYLFNQSIREGIFPADWKKARVTPIFKGKGDRNDAGNYRPISVISFVSKILEKCVQKQLLKYLINHEFITPDQSAYLKGHSTQTALHTVIDDWFSAIDPFTNLFIKFHACAVTSKFR